MDFAEQRTRMVEEQLVARGIGSRSVLDALGAVERHRFVPEELASCAYDDRPLPIGYGQTISQPYIVAFMTEALECRGGEKVLEVGCGSGYQAAVLARLGCRVFSVERIDALATRARALFGELGFNSIEVHVGDGSLGLSAAAPFDRIIVTAAGPSVPDSLYEQLTPAGILVMPVGGRFCQHLLRIRRRDGGRDEERLLSCVFVPLVGAEAWKESS